MPGAPFEFVRLVVLPSIRPGGVDPTASMDLPEEGVASISGTGGGVIDLTFSVSHSWSRQTHKEEERTYDKMKTFHTRPDGSVDEDSYVEWENVTKIKSTSGEKAQYSKMPTSDNVELVESGLTRRAEY